jgi:hypothetical protein
MQIEIIGGVFAGTRIDTTGSDVKISYSTSPSNAYTTSQIFEQVYDIEVPCNGKNKSIFGDFLDPQKAYTLEAMPCVVLNSGVVYMRGKIQLIGSKKKGADIVFVLSIFSANFDFWKYLQGKTLYDVLSYGYYMDKFTLTAENCKSVNRLANGFNVSETLRKSAIWNFPLHENEEVDYETALLYEKPRPYFFIGKLIEDIAKGAGLQIESNWIANENESYYGHQDLNKKRRHHTGYSNKKLTMLGLSDFEVTDLQDEVKNYISSSRSSDYYRLVGGDNYDGKMPKIDDFPINASTFFYRNPLKQDYWWNYRGGSRILTKNEYSRELIDLQMPGITGTFSFLITSYGGVAPSNFQNVQASFIASTKKHFACTQTTGNKVITPEIKAFIYNVPYNGNFSLEKSEFTIDIQVNKLFKRSPVSSSWNNGDPYRHFYQSGIQSEMFIRTKTQLIFRQIRAGQVLSENAVFEQDFIGLSDFKASPYVEYDYRLLNSQGYYYEILGLSKTLTLKNTSTKSFTCLAGDILEVSVRFLALGDISENSLSQALLLEYPLEPSEMFKEWIRKKLNISSAPSQAGDVSKNAMVYMVGIISSGSVPPIGTPVYRYADSRNGNYENIGVRCTAFNCAIKAKDVSVGTGSTFEIRQVLPDKKATDFMADTAKAFGLRYEVRGNTFICEKIQDYYSKGNVKNWGGNIDADNIEYGLFEENTDSLIEFEFNKTEDQYSERSKQNNVNDWNLVQNTTKILNVNSSNENVNFNMLPLSVDSFAWALWNNEGKAIDLKHPIGYVTRVSGQDEGYTGSVPLKNSEVKENWAWVFNGLNSPYFRTLKAYFFMRKAFFEGFNMNDLILVNGCLWTIGEIQELNPATEDKVMVKLNKYIA